MSLAIATICRHAVKYQRRGLVGGVNSRLAHAPQITALNGVSLTQHKAAPDESNEPTQGRCTATVHDLAEEYLWAYNIAEAY